MIYLGVLPNTYGALKEMFPELFEYAELMNKRYLLDRGFEDKTFIKDLYDEQYSSQDANHHSIEIRTYSD
jgi:hypothetical protein